MGRAPCCEKVGLKKGRWTAEEDEILVNYVKTNGEGSWRSLPKNAGLLRCGKSCRLRWINYLRADLKRGDISPQEEETIIKLQSSLGNRWSLIAAHLPGRTDNEIKNYWNSHLSRRIHSFRRINGDGARVIMDLGRIVGVRRRRQGGRTSRSAMKKKSGVDGSIASDRNSRGGAGFPTNQGQSEATGGGGSMTSLSHAEQVGSSELLDLWEASGEVGSELFCSSGDMGDGFLGASEESWCWVSAEEREGVDCSAVSSPSVEGQLRATTSSSSTGGDRDGVPPPDSSLLRELLAGGPVDGVEAGVGDTIGQRDVERGGHRSSAVDTWVDMELEEMAARLWDEVGEAGPW